jgi:hypothetical protein
MAGYKESDPPALDRALSLTSQLSEAEHNQIIDEQVVRVKSLKRMASKLSNQGEACNEPLEVGQFVILTGLEDHGHEVTLESEEDVHLVKGDGQTNWKELTGTDSEGNTVNLSDASGDQKWPVKVFVKGDESGKNGCLAVTKAWDEAEQQWSVRLQDASEIKVARSNMRLASSEQTQGQLIEVTFMSMGGNEISTATFLSGTIVKDLKRAARDATKHQLIRLLFGDVQLHAHDKLNEVGIGNGSKVTVIELAETHALVKEVGEQLIQGDMQSVDSTDRLHGPKILGILIDGAW